MAHPNPLPDVMKRSKNPKLKFSGTKQGHILLSWKHKLFFKKNSCRKRKVFFHKDTRCLTECSRSWISFSSPNWRFKREIRSVWVLHKNFTRGESGATAQIKLYGKRYLSRRWTRTEFDLSKLDWRRPMPLRPRLRQQLRWLQLQPALPTVPRRCKLCTAP